MERKFRIGDEITMEGAESGVIHTVIAYTSDGKVAAEFKPLFGTTGFKVAIAAEKYCAPYQRTKFNFEQATSYLSKNPDTLFITKDDVRMFIEDGAIWITKPFSVFAVWTIATLEELEPPVENDGMKMFKFRQKFGLTQDQLAVKLGCSSQSVSRWEITGSVKKAFMLALDHLETQLDEETLDTEMEV